MIDGENENGNSLDILLAQLRSPAGVVPFVGLDKDQTLDVLGDLHSEVPGVTHYAILAAKHSIKALRRRRDELSRYGITPLWFAPGDLAQIESILEELLHETSTRVIWTAATSATARRRQRTRTCRPIERGPQSVLPAAEADEQTRRFADRLLRGDMAFFLGAGVHLGKLPSANAFNSALARDYGFKDADAQRAEVMQYLIDREGKPRLGRPSGRSWRLPTPSCAGLSKRLGIDESPPNFCAGRAGPFVMKRDPRPIKRAEVIHGPSSIQATG